AALIWLLGPRAVGAFSASPEVAELALSYLRIETLALPCFVVLYAVQSVLQGIGKPRFPVVASLWRQGLGLGLFGVLFTGPLGLGVVGMWWAVAVSIFTGTVMLALGGAYIARGQGLVLWGRPAGQ
ncbi:MAG: MATE family efflux transporter, partial [Myxococcota bacterium]